MSEQSVGGLQPGATPGDVLELPLPRGGTLSLRWCPAGEFLMGSPEADPQASWAEKPRHPVRLSRGYWIGRTPVTQGQWEAAVGARLGSFAEGPGADDLPACVFAWPEARRWCAALTAALRAAGALPPDAELTLPTEAQWEHACRAGTQTPWYFGARQAELAEHAWYKDNSGGRLRPVGLKRPNPWRLHDVYGNVAEWCLDDFARYPPPADPPVTDPCARVGQGLKVARGGAVDHLAAECRSASRGAIAPDNPFNEPTGLRVVCAPVGSSPPEPPHSPKEPPRTGL
jgi:formylglycine-generating enzyme required for sulfatase activity